MVAAWARPKRQITLFSCGGSKGGEPLLSCVLIEVVPWIMVLGGEAPPSDAAWLCVSTVGLSSLISPENPMEGRTQFSASSATKSTRSISTYHHDTARKAMLEEMALVWEQGEFSTVSLLLWFLSGNTVLPCPQPLGCASTAQALLCAAMCFVMARKQEP